MHHVAWLLCTRLIAHAMHALERTLKPYVSKPYCSISNLWQDFGVMEYRPVRVGMEHNILLLSAVLHDLLTTLYTVHTLYTSTSSTWCTVHCTLYTVHYTWCTEHCTLYTVPGALRHSLPEPFCSAYSTPVSLSSAAYTPHTHTHKHTMHYMYMQ